MSDELPEWLVKDGVCRAVQCLPECPAYDYGCRLRANRVAGDKLSADKEKLRYALDYIEWESETHEECQGAAADALEEAGVHQDRLSKETKS